MDFEIKYKMDYAGKMRNQINELFKQMFTDMALNPERKVYIYLTIPNTGEKIKIKSMPVLNVIEIERVDIK